MESYLLPKYAVSKRSATISAQMFYTHGKHCPKSASVDDCTEGKRNRDTPVFEKKTHIKRDAFEGLQHQTRLTRADAPSTLRWYKH